ncbi:MAG: HAMP domain-containing histidine kinase [Clostridiales bacterium]|nr:HAMP domain-containing histidine kinase [Clostridiales bacterium]
MKNITEAFLKEYFDKSLGFRGQSFNLLGFAGMTAGAVAAVVSLVEKAGPASVVVNLFASILAFCLMKIAGKRVSYRVCSLAVVVSVFMLMFPVLFFAAGGYRSGMPSFFVLAIVFTSILLDSHERTVAVVVEFVLYAACCFAAFSNPRLVNPFSREAHYVFDVVIGTILSGALLFLVVLLYAKMQNLREAQIMELNSELTTRNETLTKYDKMKNNFLAAAAHEISAPLTVISGSSADAIELLKEPLINIDEIMENYRRIEKKVVQIDGILTDLMDIVAIESGRLPLSCQPVLMSELLTSACASGFLHNDNNNTIALDLQPELPPIWVDPGKIEQVLTNLLSNAAQHTKNGTITIKLVRDRKRQIVSVTDNGEGMDAEFAASAFKEFATSKDSSEQWRHGYGLFICHQIVTAHGGDIWMDSEKGRGTSVFFALLEENDKLTDFVQ